MTDPIRFALDCLNQRLLPTLFSKGVDAAFLESWASHGRAALATRPPADDDHDRAALQGLLDRVHLVATDPAAWLGLKQGEDQSPADAQPPAPAPVDIDALLSPEGAYERGGTGQEPGAQLVSGPNGPEWWVSRTAGDLEVLLFQIRARILPHLRPPIVGIDVPGPDGDYGGLQELCDAEGVDPRVGVPLLNRAQQAWKVAAQPPAPTLTPSLDADTLKEVFAKAIARDWSTGWAALSDYVALAVEAQRAPSGNPPATEGSWDDAQQTVAERSHSHIAVSLLQLAAVNARQSRWLSSALCERAAKELESTERLRAAMAADRARRATAPASDGEREELAPAELLPTRYIHPPSGVTIERTRTDPDAWAVRRGSERMSVWGGWSIEPSPSERFDDYLAKHSFSGPHAALEVLPPPPQGEEVA